VNSRATVEPTSNTPGGNGLRAATASLWLPVAAGYQRWAPIYDRTPNPLLACEERHLLPFLTDLSNKRILDLACGTGRWLERFLSQGGALAVGVDCSAAMLRVARRKDAIAGKLAQAACESLPFCAAAFHLAICSFAVGHIQDLASLARELARVTKPGGEVFLSDLHPEAYARGWRVGFRDDNAAVQIEMLPRRAEEIVQAFDAHGFASLAQLDLRLGDPEKPIFARAGKDRSFEDARQIPAVLLCHFRRLDSATTGEADECR
jgi:ubiquinone/menaquinone biosynthesis C-methylase UbiE